MAGVPGARPKVLEGRFRHGLPPVTLRPIPALRGSTLHMTCVETYQRHRHDATGQCNSCHYPWPCPPRVHAAGVIEAAGEDPRRYDRQHSHASPEPGARRTSESELDQQPTAHVLSATVTGYALGGVNRSPATSCNWKR
jgi:hypothetical protein